MNMKLSQLAATVLASVAVTGCTPEARSDYDEAGDKMGQAAQKTSEAVATDAKKTGEAVKKGAATAAEAIDDATKEGRQIAKAAEMTIKVKNAIIAADGLEARNLNVDTVDRIIKLKGSVPTAEQKARAERIARDQAGEGFTVVNELTVSLGK